MPYRVPVVRRLEDGKGVRNLWKDSGDWALD